MEIRIIKIGDSQTIDFAAQELRKYLKLMDSGVLINIFSSDSYNDQITSSGIWLGIDEKFSGFVPEVENKTEDDAIYIDVDKFSGVITGSNKRSVLIAAYRFLRELGCNWIRPGDDGEIVPETELKGQKVFVKEKAAYRHRCVCLEGAVSYEHVYNMIDWLPKMAMSGYFVQFFIPYTFFNSWYAQTKNPYMPSEPVSVEMVEQMSKELEKEIKRRGLLYYGIGHGWTSKPLGLPSGGWDAFDGELPEGIEQYFALIGGRRQLYWNAPLLTNLCYSNKKVRDLVSDSVVDFCKKNPGMEYVAFWLADAQNNHCECHECQKKIPTDYYVMMLNEIDEKLTTKGIENKIVCLSYGDLLWGPVTEKLKNEDRFVFQFSPITRGYSKSLGSFKEEDIKPPPKYVRNKMELPFTIEENIAYYYDWRRTFKGDSFVFDYHFIWDHFKEPCYYLMAKVLMEDIKDYRRLGINGLSSCQVQRAAFPTGFPMYLMAKTLWNNEEDFEKLAEEYFTVAFGKDGLMVKDYLSALSNMMDPYYIRQEKPAVNREAAENYSKIGSFVNTFVNTVVDNLAKSSDKAVRMSWKYLYCHMEYIKILAQLLYFKASDNSEMYRAWGKLKDFVMGNEHILHPVFDVHMFIHVMPSILGIDLGKEDQMVIGRE